MSASPAEVTAIRQQLLRHGYAPLPLNGKAPTPKGWQQKLETNPAEIDLWGTMWPNAVNTGILCRFTPCLDIDILDADAAAAVEALVRERFEDGGYILIRVGLPPKRAIPFRTQEPFAKIVLPLIAPNGDTKQKLEFLSDGQQVVVDGIHPDTSKPYAWFSKSLLDVPRDELPYIRADEAQQLINDATGLLVTEHGYKRADRGGKKGNGGDHGGEHIDWASLTNKIIAGRELHDSTRDLAASYIGSGMSAAHALRQLRALMLASKAAHDERWQERFDNLPRLVHEAEEKFGKPPAELAPADLGEWDAGDNPGQIPPRPWLLGNQFCCGFISSLFAAGGVGKSALCLVQFISLSLGRSLCGQHIFRRSRVLLISLEDDREELERRIAAVLIHFGVHRRELKGWLFCSTPIGSKLAELQNNKRVPGKLGQQIRDAIARRKPDLVALDPFIKLHDLGENDSGDMNFVCGLLTRIAVESKIAVDVPHHIHKGQVVAGDADSGRGSSGIRDAGRLIFTLTIMSATEAQSFNIDPDQRFSYVRLDSAKVNIAARSGAASWFRIVGVPIGNVTPEYPAGDTIQVAEPWSPPDAWAGLSIVTLSAILDHIDAGIRDDDGQLTGERFSNAPAAKERAVWPVVQRFAPDKSEAQCRTIIHQWLTNGVLLSEPYQSHEQRRKVPGLRVDATKRPGTTTES